jgi:hypothetical protein
MRKRGLVFANAVQSSEFPSVRAKKIIKHKHSKMQHPKLEEILEDPPLFDVSGVELEVCRLRPKISSNCWFLPLDPWKTDVLPLKTRPGLPR